MPRAKKDLSPACRALTRRDWPHIETLFGERGACAGCWCMFWRVPGSRTQWQARLGERNKRAFRRLVEAGRVRGCLAFAGRDPIGWVSIGPKIEFPYFERSRSIPASADAREWCVTCFYVPARWRSKGVASSLLAAAVELAGKSGARLIEGYPLVPKHAHARAPAAFAWTGVPRLYEQCRFERAANPVAKKVIYRRRLTA
ncbi:MAG TPA: GNAT family N-acetyltransferase [Steroidobacteraceae bacterium]|nr:GNAT family N-acetyltransferase [Steroidobacteraceae bacterium]